MRFFHEDGREATEEEIAAHPTVASNKNSWNHIPTREQMIERRAKQICNERYFTGTYEDALSVATETIDSLLAEGD